MCIYFFFFSFRVSYVCVCAESQKEREWCVYLTEIVLRPQHHHHTLPHLRGLHSQSQIIIITQHILTVKIERHGNFFFFLPLLHFICYKYYKVISLPVFLQHCRNIGIHRYAYILQTSFHLILSRTPRIQCTFNNCRITVFLQNVIYVSILNALSIHFNCV